MGQHRSTRRRSQAEIGRFPHGGFFPPLFVGATLKKPRVVWHGFARPFAPARPAACGRPAGVHDSKPFTRQQFDLEESACVPGGWPHQASAGARIRRGRMTKGALCRRPSMEATPSSHPEEPAPGADCETERCRDSTSLIDFLPWRRFHHRAHPCSAYAVLAGLRRGGRPGRPCCP